MEGLPGQEGPGSHGDGHVSRGVTGRHCGQRATG